MLRDGDAFDADVSEGGRPDDLQGFGKGEFRYSGTLDKGPFLDFPDAFSQE